MVVTSPYHRMLGSREGISPSSQNPKDGADELVLGRVPKGGGVKKRIVLSLAQAGGFLLLAGCNPNPKLVDAECNQDGLWPDLEVQAVDLLGGMFGAQAAGLCQGAADGVNGHAGSVENAQDASRERQNALGVEVIAEDVVEKGMDGSRAEGGGRALLLAGHGTLLAESLPQQNRSSRGSPEMRG
jgi:hypothetical protein